MQPASATLTLLQRALPQRWRRPDLVWATPTPARGPRFRPSQMGTLSRSAKVVGKEGA